MIIMSNVFRGRTLAQKPARVVFTKHIMGRPISAPFDRERQLHVVREALGLLERATGPESYVLLPDDYRVAGS